ncbi:MAG: DUF1641 domain-containing protein [Alicyclobacillus herbarius]|uniref:DUF1641 domain-containing protein n=1 Tax=Alicyclobacillus herbarius TaxID=122960 RepID=UPI0023563A03|nr:DUF1641 domain-containing protein [Alicyclobacillus herbarius]MCL6633158.1 DUF1641 domain-containing protein [Alicyclobacillus herbarius]
MAQPIRSIAKAAVDSSAAPQNLRSNIEAAAAAHQDAVLEAIRLLAALKKTGLLEMASALLEQGSDVLEIVVRQAEKPEYAGGLKNLIGLVQLLGRLDLTRLEPLLAPFVRPMSAGIAGEEVQDVSTPAMAPVSVDGFFSILAALRDPDVSAGLSWMLGLLQAIGRGVRAKT